MTVKFSKVASYHEYFLTDCLPFAHVWSVVGETKTISLNIYEEMLSFRSGLLEIVVSIPFKCNVTKQ